MALRHQDRPRIARTTERCHQVTGRPQILDLRLEEDVDDAVVRHIVVRENLRDLLGVHKLIAELDAKRADRYRRMLRIQLQRPPRRTPATGKERHSRKDSANANWPFHRTYYTKVPRNAFNATWTGLGSSDFDQSWDWTHSCAAKMRCAASS